MFLLIVELGLVQELCEEVQPNCTEQDRIRLGGARKARQGMSRRTHSELEKEIDTLLVYVRVLARVVRVKLMMRTYQVGLFSTVLTAFTEQS